jgi:membrane fusion protein (multidrug efflux system)
MKIELMKPDRLLGALLLALVTVAGAAGGCADAGSGDAAAEEQTFTRAARVESLVVVPITFEETIQVTGAVEALNDANLAAQASGKVEYIADNGADVAKGAVVARLDQAQAWASVQQAEAALETAHAQRELARDNFERLAPLQDRKAISALEFEQSRLQLEQAEASVRQAEAALANAQVQLDNTEVRAPFAGTVESRLVDPGEHAGPGDPLIRLISVDEVKVLAGIPERYSADVKTGVSVRLDFPSARLEARVGKVSFVGAAIDPMSRTFPIEVRVPNPEGDLKPAMLAELHVPRKTHVDVLTLPRSAVVFDELGPGVYVVTESEGRTVAERRPVVLGANAVGFVVIETGLDPGDEVVIQGQHNLASGDAIEVSLRHTVPPGAEAILSSLQPTG